MAADPVYLLALGLILFIGFMTIVVFLSYLALKLFVASESVKKLLR